MEVGERSCLRHKNLSNLREWFLTPFLFVQGHWQSAGIVRGRIRGRRRFWGDEDSNKR